MKKCLIIAFILFVFCTKFDNEKYPSTIVKDNLEKKYDIAKFCLYEKYIGCSGSCSNQNSIKSSDLIIEDLILKKVNKYGDTTEFLFFFNCNNDGCYIPDKCEFYTTVGFIGQSNNVVFMEWGSARLWNNKYMLSLKGVDSMNFIRKYGALNKSFLEDAVAHDSIEAVKNKKYLYDRGDNVNPWIHSYLRR